MPVAPLSKTPRKIPVQTIKLCDIEYLVLNPEKKKTT
jgi:hypothetical protein